MPVGTPTGKERSAGAGTHTRYRQRIAGQRSAGARPQVDPTDPRSSTVSARGGRQLARARRRGGPHTRPSAWHPGRPAHDRGGRGAWCPRATQSCPPPARPREGWGRGKTRAPTPPAGRGRCTAGAQVRAREGKGKDVAHLEDFHHATHGQRLLHEHACLHIPHGSAAVPQRNESRRGSAALVIVTGGVFRTGSHDRFPRRLLHRDHKLTCTTRKIQNDIMHGDGVRYVQLAEHEHLAGQAGRQPLPSGHTGASRSPAHKTRRTERGSKRPRRDPRADEWVHYVTTHAHKSCEGSDIRAQQWLSNQCRGRERRGRGVVLPPETSLPKH